MRAAFLLDRVSREHTPIDPEPPLAAAWFCEDLARSRVRYWTPGNMSERAARRSRWHVPACSGTLASAVKLAATTLILPTLIVLGIAAIEMGVLYPPPSHKPTQGIVWRGNTFASRADFARWLRARGIRYRVWARRHPALAGVEHRNRSAQRSTQRKTKPGGTRHNGSRWIVKDLGGGAAFLAVLSLGVVLVRRRRRPDRDQIRPATAKLRTRLRRRLPSPVAEAVEQSAWEVATLAGLLPLLVYVGLLLIRA
jgi:hypothetical protein